MDKNLGRLTLETVRVVHQVLIKKNMTLVSSGLGLTQPAVTFHVKKFENILGRKILSRVGNNLITSDDAQQIIDICEGILRKGSDLESYTSKKRDMRKSIGISADVIASFITHCPNASNILERYQLVVDQPNSLSSRFDSGELQAVFRPIDLAESPPDLAVDVPFRWAGSSRLRGRLTEDTKALPIILESRRSIYATMARKALEDIEAPYQIVAEVNDFEALRTLLEGGVGYALIPQFRSEYLDVEPETQEQSLRATAKGSFGFFHHKREIALVEAMDLFDELSNVLAA